MCLSKLQDAITFAQHLDQHGQCTMDLGPITARLEKYSLCPKK